jgi:hypothetical protein
VFIDFFRDHMTNQCSKPVRGGNVGKTAEKPPKPRKNFPLRAHPTGQCAKEIIDTGADNYRCSPPSAAASRQDRLPPRPLDDH